MHIAIVGAGISGLAAAFYLQRARPDWQLTVFDRTGRAGGTMQTVDCEGFLFEAGGNGFLTNKPDTLELVSDAGAEDLLLRSADAARKRHVFTDRLHRLPESPGAFLRTPLLTWSQKLRVAGELLVPARREAGDESLWDFGCRRLGAGFTGVFLDAMVAGIYATTPQRISVQSAFPAVAALEREHGGLFRGMLAKRKSGAGPGGVLMSFHGGVSRFIDHLVGQIDADWQLAADISAVEYTGDGYRLQGAEGEAWEADQVVVATPAFAAARILSGLDAALVEDLREIDYSPVAVVGLGYRQPVAALDGFGLLTTTAAQQPVLGVLWDSSIFADRAPPGAQSLRVLIGGQRQPELAAQDDAGLVATALQGVRQTMGVAATPDVTFVRTWRHGIPNYALGHRERVARILARLSGHAGLYLTSNAYQGIAMNDCVRNGRELAAEMMAEAPA